MWMAAVRDGFGALPIWMQGVFHFEREILLDR
jgi:hypothetical protein